VNPTVPLEPRLTAHLRPDHPDRPRGLGRLVRADRQCDARGRVLPQRLLPFVEDEGTRRITNRLAKILRLAYACADTAEDRLIAALSIDSVTSPDAGLAALTAGSAIRQAARVMVAG